MEPIIFISVRGDETPGSVTRLLAKHGWQFGNITRKSSFSARGTMEKRKCNNCEMRGCGLGHSSDELKHLIFIRGHHAKLIAQDAWTRFRDKCDKKSSALPRGSESPGVDGKQDA